MQPKPVEGIPACARTGPDGAGGPDDLWPKRGECTDRVSDPAADTRDAVVLDLISSIFSNDKAGLLDLNLNKQQKLQGAQAELEQYKDYGVLLFAGSPRQGQTLEQVRDLLLQQILLLKKGRV